jgi:hypothetical protein
MITGFERRRKTSLIENSNFSHLRQKVGKEYLELKKLKYFL